MDSITLENYRCFGEKQTARLAPLTLLVGPNSTGKTSFLALIRALLNLALRGVIPNFQESPFHLGSFEDIVHQTSGRTNPQGEFGAGFGKRSATSSDVVVDYAATFRNRKGVPYPVKRSLALGDRVFEACARGDGNLSLRFVAGNEEVLRPNVPNRYGDGDYAVALFPNLMSDLVYGSHVDDEAEFLQQWASDDVRDCAWDLLHQFERAWPMNTHALSSYSGGPVRSHPRRTYDPMRQAQDAEGEYIPSYLAGLFRRDAEEWQLLKSRLQEFGRASGLFDEITVRSFGKSEGDPFQLQIRKYGKEGKGKKGPYRNLTDVGYGVSQALPVLTELLLADAPETFLLQQPEVHLHPSAQAALGTLFCQIAAGGRQLVVESHSDYLIDRVRMDVRDGATGLKPEDVSILYFEPGDLDVKIHSIRIDEMGNVLDAPHSYGEFFMAETRRSIGL